MPQEVIIKNIQIQSKDFANSEYKEITQALIPGDLYFFKKFEFNNKIE